MNCVTGKICVGRPIAFSIFGQSQIYLDQFQTKLTQSTWIQSLSATDMINLTDTTPLMSPYFKSREALCCIPLPSTTSNGWQGRNLFAAVQTTNSGCSGIHLHKKDSQPLLEHLLTYGSRRAKKMLRGCQTVQGCEHQGEPYTIEITNSIGLKMPCRLRYGNLKVTPNKTSLGVTFSQRGCLLLLCKHWSC